MRRPPLGKESWKHKNIFETYLLLGPARTIPLLSKATGITATSLNIWRKKFDWDSRVYNRDQKAMACIEVENDKVLKTTIMRRHQEAYQAIQEKALSYLTKNSTSFSRSKSPARDASIALDIGVKGERDVLGLRDTKVKGAIVKEGFAALMEMVMPS